MNNLRGVGVVGTMRALPCALLVSSLSLAAVLVQSTPARAQDDTARARAEVNAVANRLQQEIACLTRTQTDLQRVLRLMEEARTQSTAAAASERARADARETIRALAQRAVEIERQITGCRTELSTRARAPGPVEGVVYRDAPPDPTAEAVAQPSSATRVIEENQRIHPSITVVRGERVDGMGNVEAAAVTRGVRAQASELARCYDRVVDHGALVRGTIILTFTVAADGRALRVTTEQDRIRSRGFAACIASAGRRIHLDRGATGGTATYSYTLHFPAE